MVSRTFAFFCFIRQCDHCSDERRQRVGKPVVAVDARQLFQQIDLALDIEAPGGNLDGETIAVDLVLAGSECRSFRIDLSD